MDKKKIPMQLVNGNSNKVLSITVNFREVTTDIPQRLTAVKNTEREMKSLRLTRATSSSRIHQPGLHSLTRRMHMFLECPEELSTFSATSIEAGNITDGSSIFYFQSEQ